MLGGRNHPALDPGIALPLAPLGNQVFLQRGKTHHQRATVAIRAQTHVHAEHITVAGHIVNQVNQALAQAGEKIVIVDGAATIGFAVFRVNENQVDVGRHIQFAAAQLAHANDEHFLWLLAVATNGRAILRVQQLRHAALRSLHHHLGQGGHGAHHLRQIGQAIQIAQNQLHHYPLPQLPHGTRQAFLIAAIAVVTQKIQHVLAAKRRGVSGFQPVQQSRASVQSPADITATSTGFAQ